MCPGGRLQLAEKLDSAVAFTTGSYKCCYAYPRSHKQQNSECPSAPRVDSIQEGQTHHPPDILGLRWIQESRRWLGPNKVAGRTRWQLDRWRQCKIKRRRARRDGRSFKAQRSDAMRGWSGDRSDSQERSEEEEWQSSAKWARQAFRTVNTWLLAGLESRRHASSATVRTRVYFSPIALTPSSAPPIYVNTSCIFFCVQVHTRTRWYKAFPGTQPEPKHQK